MIENKEVKEGKNMLVRLFNNPVKEYAWGMANKECYVGRFCGSELMRKNYAELWMGIHPHG